MSDHPITAKTIFLNALDIPSAEARQAYIVAQCDGNKALGGEVEALLRQHGDLGSFLESPAAGPTLAMGGSSLGELSGTTIGPYKLLQQIGEGGMGIVFMAEQQQPVQRKVALKIIKPGMDTRQVIARFEAERQALALMDHPNIAKVLDAGATESGRPYFVMELVKGVPITTYCDEHHLTPRQRLELFAPVCHAVQHAHQKGIIHRDLKPSNVMIALYDGRPVPKIIDFGVAKATGQTLTQRTMFTEYGAIVGTIEYMSPEQAELNQLDIDTRSDIYSLGVLLYELLTSLTPFEKNRLRSAAFDEMLRIIREEDPPKPSTRLSTTSELPTIAASRGIEPKKLSRLMRGELDWIVMKCLEKDRNRRYETANGLYEDLERYLTDQPVRACPPSAGYRIRKLVKRNRRTVAMVGVLAVVILAAVAVAAGSIGWAVRDREARQAIVEQQVVSALDASKADYEQDQLADAEAGLKEAEGLAATGELRPDIEQRIRQWNDDLKMVRRLEETQLERAALKDERYLINFDSVTDSYRLAFGEYGFDIDRSDLNTIEPRTRNSPIKGRLVAALDDWAIHERPQRRKTLLKFVRDVDNDPWRNRLRDAIEHDDSAALRQLAQGDDILVQSPVTIHAMALAANAQLPNDSLAVDLLRHAQRLHPADFSLNEFLGILLVGSKPEEAVSFFRTAIARRPDSPGAKLGLGIALQREGKLAEAEAEIRDVLHLKPDSALACGYLASILEDKGDSDAAEAEFQEAIRRMPDLVYVRYWFAEFLERRERWNESKRAYGEAIKIQPEFAPPYRELASLLCFGPRIEPSDPARAVELATKGTRLEPGSSRAWFALGFAQYRAGQWQSSIQSLEKSNDLDTEPKGGDSGQWLILAMDHWRLDHKDAAHRWYARAAERLEQQQLADTDPHHDLQAEAARLLGEPLSLDLLQHLARFEALNEHWDSAAASYAEAMDKSADNDNWDSPRKRICRDVAQWDEVFKRVATLRPKEADLWIGRGDYRVFRNRWSEARDDFAKIVDVHSVQDNSLEHAALLLLLSSPGEYQDFCNRLATAAGEPKSDESAFIIARTMALGPARAVDVQTVVAWADRAAKAEPRPWQLHVLGLALFRAGEYDLAMSRLEDSNGGKWSTIAKAQNWLVQAMIHERRGQLEEARRLLDRAHEAIRAVQPSKPNEPVRAIVGPTDWLELAVLSREAESVIRPASSPPANSTELKAAAD